MPGTIDGWAKALALVPEDRRLPLSDLLAPAIALARDGIAVTANQSLTTTAKLDTLKGVQGFDETFLVNGQPPAPGHLLRQTALGNTLARLAEVGLNDNYRGEIAATHAQFLADAGSPLRLADFHLFTADQVTPLTVGTSAGQLYNMIAPTQGVSSLMILALFDRLGVEQGEGFAHLHGLIEATKQAFIQHNAELGDPDTMSTPAQDWLTPSHRLKYANGWLILDE